MGETKGVVQRTAARFEESAAVAGELGSMAVQMKGSGAGELSALVGKKREQQ
jgi:hypothetical protein